MTETIPRAMRPDAESPDAAESALADRLFELVARIRRPRPIGPPRGEEADEQHRQRHGQMRMLLALGHAAPLTVQDLARVLDVSAPTASVLAKKAFAEGLVIRRKDPNDSRVVWLDLADAGREHLRTHRLDRVRRLDQLIDSHPDLDRTEIARAVEVLLRLFDRDPRLSGPPPESDQHPRCSGIRASFHETGEA